MTVATETTVYDITDAKVFPMTADTGASPTYGTGIDVPLIATASMNPNVIAAELKGDGGIIGASKARIDKFTIALTYGMLELNVLATVWGGTVDASGQPNWVDYNLQFGPQLPLFGLALEIPDVDDELGVGDLLAFFYKCRVASATFLNQQTDQFGQPTMEITCYKPRSSITRAMKLRLAAVDTPITVMI